MTGLRRFLCLGGLFWCWLTCQGPVVVAQDKPSRAGSEPRETIVQVELLSGTEGGALSSQAWLKVFEEFEVELIIRRGLVTDKPELREKTVGTLRYVTLIGKLTRSGDIEFPGKMFGRGDAAALKEWLDELKTYGVQGIPTGKPLWGLSKQQFEELFAGLSEPVSTEPRGLTIPAGIEALGIDPKCPLRWSTAAEASYRELASDTSVVQGLKGFTKGTALAVLLKERGFGFRPNRVPSGAIELLVVPWPEDPFEAWPVGWPTQVTPSTLLPSLYKLGNLDVPKAPLLQVLERAAVETDIPILIDYDGLARQGFDLETLEVEFLLKKSNWSLALRTMLVPQKLQREIWQDEAGRGFLWITPLGPARRPSR